jgi:hypothetical protein
MLIVRALILLLFLFPALSGAEETSLRTVQLPESGSLQLRAPRSWKDQLHQSRNVPPTIVFGPEQGNDFQVQITPMRGTTGAAPDKDELLDIVLNAAEEAKQQAVERSIPVVEMKGDSGIGYYFTATDRDPKPVFTHLTKGILQIGEVAAFFTILSKDGGEATTSDALKMLKGARYVKNTVITPHQASPTPVPPDRS